MRGGRDAEIGVELLVDVREAPRQRAHVPLDRERQADRMARRRVRVLTDDEHLDVRERALERPQDAVARRQVRPPGRDLLAQAFAERRDVGRDGRESLRPAGVDQPGLRQFGKRQRHRGQADRSAAAVSSSRTEPWNDHGKSIQSDVAFHEKSGWTIVVGFV